MSFCKHKCGTGFNSKVELEEHEKECFNGKKSPADRLEQLDAFVISFESAILDLMLLAPNLTAEKFEKKVYELECWLHDAG